MTTLFVLSDTHGRPWPTPLAACDAVLFAGDLIDGASAEEDVSAGDPDPLTLQWLRRTAGLDDATDFGRVLAVRGNHDADDPARFFSAATDLSDGRLRRIGGVWVGGVGWHGRYYADLPGDVELRPRCDALRRAVNRQVMPREPLVLLTHYPPALSSLPGARPDAGFSNAVADLVRDLRPAAVVAGHIHEWAGTVDTAVFQGGETLLVMPGPAGMLLSIVDDGVATAAVR